VACYTNPTTPRDPNYVCPCELTESDPNTPACDGVAAVLLKTANLDAGISGGFVYLQSEASGRS